MDQGGNNRLREEPKERKRDTKRVDRDRTPKVKHDDPRGSNVWRYPKLQQAAKDRSS